MGLVKYNRDGTEITGIRKGNWLYKDSLGEGPTSETGWYNIPEIPVGGGILLTDGAYAYPFTEKLQGCSVIDNRNYKRNSARGEWICMTTGTVDVIAPFSNTLIQENGTTLISDTGTNPYRTSIQVTAGKTYKGNKPIVFTDADGGHRMVPVNLRSNHFANYSSRAGNSNYFIYNPNDENISVRVYQNTGGLTGFPIEVIDILPKTVATYIGTSDVGWYWFVSETHDYCMSVTEDGGDRHVLAPAGNYIYTRRSGYDTTMNGTSPQNQGTYHNYDSNTKCISVEIADGNGYDSCQHLALENLSNTYAYGNALSDYHITMPFAGEVKVYYANSDSNGGWVELNTHTFNGSLLSPGQIGVDGDGGSYDDSGNAPYFVNGAALWLFKGTKPFKLTINDTSNDEETLFGWMEHENDIVFSSIVDLNSYIDTRDDWVVLE